MWVNATKGWGNVLNVLPHPQSCNGMRQQVKSQAVNVAHGVHHHASCCNVTRLVRPAVEDIGQPVYKVLQQEAMTVAVKCAATTQHTCL